MTGSMPDAKTGTDQSGRGRRTQADRTKKALNSLRKAALELICEEGVGQLNLSRVGERAGYSRGIVHYHFGSRQDLLNHLLEDITDRSFRQLTDSGKSGLELLELFVDIMTAEIARSPETTVGRFLIMTQASESDSAEVRDVMVKYNNKIRSLLEDAFRQCTDDHVDREAKFEPHDAAVVSLATLRGIIHQWIADRDGFNVAQAMRSLGRLVQELSR